MFPGRFNVDGAFGIDVKTGDVMTFGKIVPIQNPLVFSGNENRPRTDRSCAVAEIDPQGFHPVRGNPKRRGNAAPVDANGLGPFRNERFARAFGPENPAGLRNGRLQADGNDGLAQKPGILAAKQKQGEQQNRDERGKKTASVLRFNHFSSSRKPGGR